MDWFRRPLVLPAAAVTLLGIGFLAGRFSAPRVAILRIESPFGPPREVSAPGPAEAAEAPAPAPPKEPDPTPLRQPLRRGDIEFTVDSAEVAPLTLKEGYRGARLPAGPILIVRYTVRNVGEGRRYFFREYVPALTDDAGNHYKYVDYVPGDTPELGGYAHEPHATIDPGAAIRNAATFEPPLGTARELTLAIPAVSIARSEDEPSYGPTPPYRFAIPVPAIEK